MSMPSHPNDWRAYFKSKFRLPNSTAAEQYAEQPESVQLNSRFPDWTVSVSDVTANAFRLKKKKSCGVDGFFAIHLVNGTRLLYERLTLLYHIRFVVGFLPDIFCTGQLTPIMKKGKPAMIHSSYDQITVSPVFVFF